MNGLLKVAAISIPFAKAADVLTTAYALRRGAVEVNPISAAFLKSAGFWGNYALTVSMGLAILALVLWADAHRGFAGRPLVALTNITVVGSAVCVGTVMVNVITLAVGGLL